VGGQQLSFQRTIATGGERAGFGSIDSRTDGGTGQVQWRAVRVIASCRIEFEGSALYVTEEAQEARAAHQAVWLQLKWPLLPERRALNGKYVLVEGRFDAGLR